jgi:GMP synthase (glutamine-hydrolysing)
LGANENGGTEGWITVELDKIIVFDFGSQYSNLICRRVREANVYCELLPFDTSAEEIGKMRPSGIIFSGGPSSVYFKNSPRPDKKIFEMGIPILGICYGHQLIVDRFGGVVRKSDGREYGHADLIVDNKTDLFNGLADRIKCWMSHGDAAEMLPPGFEILGHTENSFSAAIANRQRKVYGIQFHPEVVHTEHGIEILKNFVRTISKAKPSWNMKSFTEAAIDEIKQKVGEEKVLCALSGGIDSATVAMLLDKAIGENLKCVFVDHGLLRENESALVGKLFKQHLQSEVIYVNAEKQFLEKLKGISDPEMKRRIIGEEFARVFMSVVKENGPFQWLAQGTLYPDVIESGVSKGPASAIKSHHNVAGLPEWLSLKTIEPLRTLYKDEVRRVARLLGMPNEFIQRHPFPGPGLAVRIIGEVTSEKIRIAKSASKIIEEELVASGLYHNVWQAFASVGDDRAVGVVGDQRLYGHIVIIRIVESIDAMTADWCRLPYDLLRRLSDRITNEVEDVSWVTYAVSSKPPSTIEPQ